MEKFKDGQRVSVIESARTGQPKEQYEGVVDGYEYYHGVRVWIRADDNLYYAYPEDTLTLEVKS